MYDKFTLKVLLWSKIDSYIFFHKSKVLMFNTYHAKLQVFTSTRRVIDWAIISGFGRPPLQNSNMARNNWEKWGGRGSDVIQSRQQKQFGYFSMGQVSSWKVFAVVFFLIRSKIQLNSSVHDKSMPANRCVMQDFNNGSNPREGISFHNSPPRGIVLSSWKRLVSSHHKNFNPTGRFAVCSEHFTDDCFARYYHFGGSMKRHII